MLIPRLLNGTFGLWSTYPSNILTKVTIIRVRVTHKYIYIYISTVDRITLKIDPGITGPFSNVNVFHHKNMIDKDQNHHNLQEIFTKKNMSLTSMFPLIHIQKRILLLPYPSATTLLELKLLLFCEQLRTLNGVVPFKVGTVAVNLNYGGSNK